MLRADGTPDTLQAVRSLLASGQLDAAARETYLEILAEIGDAKDLASLMHISDESLQARLLPALGIAARVRHVRPDGDLTAALRPLIESHHPGLRAEALRLAGVWRLEAFLASAKAAANDSAEAESIRRASIEALGFYGDSADLTKLSSSGPPSIRSAAIAALCPIDPGRAAESASELCSSSADEAAFTEVFTAFLKRQGGAAALAQSLSVKAPSKAAAELGLRIMSSSGRGNEELAAVLTVALGVNNPNKIGPAEIPSLAEEVRSAGDPKRGGEIFRRPSLGCAACHAVNGVGGKIGPELSALGTAQPIDFIIGAILDPQKEVKEGYVSISVTTKDGEEYQGYQVRETSAELVLRDVLQNKEIRLRRDAIQEKKQIGSVMPSGLADLLTRSDFRDLVRYLSELGKPAN